MVFGKKGSGSLDADVKDAVRESEVVAPSDVTVTGPTGGAELPPPEPAPGEPGAQPIVVGSQPPVSERVTGDGKVRAKFKCLGVDKQPGDNGYALRFEAVTSGSRENTLFYQYTPSGQLTMGVVREETAKKFESGREYYLDFTPA